MARRRLSQRQIERIRTIQERRRRHLAERANDVLDGLGEEAPPRPGLVMARYGANLAVEDDGGGLHHCVARRHIGHPVCGDRVVWQTAGDGQGVVTAIEPRRSVLSRPDYSGRDKPLAANLTRVVVLLAPRPEPGTYLLDQYLVAAERIGVEALILGTKMDLLDGEEAEAFRARFAHYPGIGYPTLWISLRAPATLAPLTAALADQTSILVGQSGVGKSSLVKALLPDREVQVGRLSKATGLGRHTTSAATCYRLPFGGLLIDSPGVRSFRLGAIDRDTLQQGFRELRPYIGHCRFADCHHDREPDCAVRAAVAAGAIHPERLANLLHLESAADEQRGP